MASRIVTFLFSLICIGVIVGLFIYAIEPDLINSLLNRAIDSWLEK